MNVLNRFSQPHALAHTSRVRRIIELIAYLQKWRTVKECAILLDVSTRSIHRYFNLLINLGFIVEQKRHDPFYRLTYRLTNTIEVFKVEWSKNKDFIDVTTRGVGCHFKDNSNDFDELSKLLKFYN